MTAYPTWWPRPHRAALAVFATLVCLAVAMLVAALATPQQSHAAPRPWICPNLLLSFECDEYRQLLGQALSRDERAAVTREIAFLVADRRRACRCVERPAASGAQ